MNYAVFAPPVQLKDSVRNFWILESAPGEVLPKQYQSMADGYAELIFQYNRGFLAYNNFNAYLRAQHSEYKLLDLGESIGLFGVRFYPHAIQQLFRIPAHVLTNTIYDFNIISDYKMQALIEKVLLSSTHGERIKLVSDFLTQIVIKKNPDPIHKFVKQVIQLDGQVNLGQMQQQTGLSVSQFERRFKVAAGFTPKYYARMMRFTSTKRKYVTGNYQSLSELAYACNYYDQSHFIREFKEFSGMQVHEYFNLLDQDYNQEAKVIKGLIIAKDLPSPVTA